MRALKKSQLISISLALVTIAVLVSAQIAYQAPTFFNGEAGTFSYTGQGESNRSVYVVISVHHNDPEALNRHINANKQRAQELPGKTVGSIPVLVTFSKPISQEEARILASNTDLQVRSFLMVGRSPITGKRGTHIEFSGLEKTIASEINMDRDGQNDRIVLQGVMVLKGEVANPSSLIKLTQDERVYLADTSEFELRNLLKQRHAAATEGKEINVSLESPYWDLSW